MATIVGLTGSEVIACRARGEGSDVGPGIGRYLAVAAL